MGIFTGLFGGGRGTKPPTGEVRELAAPLAVPAVHLVRADGETSCYFGGRPELPLGVVWPCKNGKPLAFLAHVDLAAVAAVLPYEWLPSSGTLLFFYDVDSQPWGFDPKDRGSWSVMYIDAHTAVSASDPTAAELPTLFLSPRRIASLPSWQRPQVSALQLSDEQAEELIDVSTSVYGQSPCHQIGGYPNPIQGDEMELECQLASHGIYVCGAMQVSCTSGSASRTRAPGDLRTRGWYCSVTSLSLSARLLRAQPRRSRGSRADRSARRRRRYRGRRASRGLEQARGPRSATCPHRQNR